jgi:hypothetical protein
MKPLAVALGAVVTLVVACTSSTAGSGGGSPVAHLDPATPASPSQVSSSTSTATSPTSSSAPSSSTSTVHSTPTSSAPPPGPRTQQTVVRPVTSGGAAAPGWSVHSQPLAITCSPDEPSPVAVDPGIAYCSPSAAFAIACWHSEASSALCVADVAHRTLARYPVAGSFDEVSAPAAPAPFRLTLANGATCTVRDGGATSNLTDHPDWVVWYFCSDQTAVYGPENGNGIDASDALWRVEIGSVEGEGDVTPVAVRTAIYVGTARD